MNDTIIARPGRMLAVLLLLAAVLPAARAADICKWVDDAGRVHYSDVPPTAPACVALIRIEHPDPAERERAEARRAREIARLQQAESERAAAERRGGEPPAADRAARCANARDELKFLEQATGMRLVRPGHRGDAPIDWVDDAERGALLAAWRTEVRAWCEGIGEAPADPPERAYAVPPPPR